MTKEKIKYIIKRMRYYIKMMSEGKTADDYWISKKKEHLVIDDEVLEVFDVIEEIIESEEEPWLQALLKDIRRGRKGLAIEVESPVQHTKFNLTKERFISKVYECCIYKHFVTYEDILKSKIG